MRTPALGSLALASILLASSRADGQQEGEHTECTPPADIVEAEDRLLEGLVALPLLGDRVGPAQLDVATKAAALGPDPRRAFEFVRDWITYEPYPGSARGGRGALICRAGNAVDQ